MTSSETSFDTYSHLGGVLLNHMHEFILGFEKPMKPSHRKYAHVSREQGFCVVNQDLGCVADESRNQLTAIAIMLLLFSSNPLVG